jgi:hypothetical protein
MTWSNSLLSQNGYNDGHEQAGRKPFAQTSPMAKAMWSFLCAEHDRQLGVGSCLSSGQVKPVTLCTSPLMIMPR